MARRKVPALDAARRAALIRDMRLFADMERQAAADKTIYVLMAYDAGMTTREIGAALGVSYQTVSRWKAEGERERERRRSGDPDRPGERRQVS